MKLTESTASHIDNRHFLHNVLPSSIHAPDWFIIYPRDTQKNPSAFCNVSRERKKEDEEASRTSVQNIPICRFGGHTTNEGNKARIISITSCILSTDGIKLPPAFPLIWPRAWSVCCCYVYGIETCNSCLSRWYTAVHLVAAAGLQCRNGAQRDRNGQCTIKFLELMTLENTGCNHEWF